MRTLAIVILLFFSPALLADWYDNAYLCANSKRYFDGVAIGSYKVLTAAANIPKRLRDEMVTLYGPNGNVTYGFVTKRRWGMLLIETMDDLPDWAYVPYRPPYYQERVTVISTKDNRVLTGYTTNAVTGTSKFGMTCRNTSAGSGIYANNGHLIGIWYGNGTWNGQPIGVGLAFGTFR